MLTEGYAFSFSTSTPHTQLLIIPRITINKETRLEWQIHSNIQPTLKDVTRLLAYKNPVNHSFVFARREAFLEAGDYSEELISQFDYDLWIRVAAGNHRIARIELPLVAKRWYENQSFEATKHFTYVLRSCKMRSRVIKACKEGRCYGFTSSQNYLCLFLQEIYDSLRIS